MLDDRQALTAFLGLLLVTMGATLSADAEQQADAVAGWGGKEAEEGQRARLVSLYRLGGALFAAAGAGLAACAFVAPALVSRHLGGLSLGGPARRATGAALLLLGAFSVGGARPTTPKPLPAALEAEGLLAPAKRRGTGRAAAAWARGFLCCAYGAFLLVTG